MLIQVSAWTGNLLRLTTSSLLHTSPGEIKRLCGVPALPASVGSIALWALNALNRKIEWEGPPRAGEIIAVAMVRSGSTHGCRTFENFQLSSSAHRQI